MTFFIRGIDDAIAEGEARALRIQDLTPALQVLAEELRTLIDDSFDESHTPDARKWIPLADSTIRQRRGKSSKPLADTNRLRSSITTKTKPRTIEFGTNVKYAAAQQFGTIGQQQTVRGRKRKRREQGPLLPSGRFSEHKRKGAIPARPYLPITPDGEFMQGGAAGEFIRSIEESLLKYIETGELPR